MKKNVLIADSDKKNAAEVGRYLHGQGYGVNVVHDGEACLEAMMRAPADLLITELVMPKINGGRVIQMLKLDAATSDIPVFVLTGVSGEKYKRTALFELGVKYYLVKPTLLKDLGEKVHDAFCYQMLETRQN